MFLLAWTFWISADTIVLSLWTASLHGNTSYGIIAHHSEDFFKNTRTLEKYNWEYLIARFSFKFNSHIAYIKHIPGPPLKNTCFNSQYFSLLFKKSDMVTCESFRKESATWCYQSHLLSFPFLLPIISTFDYFPWSNPSIHFYSY